MGAGADRLVAVDAAGADDADGRPLFLHRAGLNAAGMGPQQPVGVLMDIEGILHIAGRMVFRKVERGKIMPVVFDLGAFCNRKAQPAEDMDDLVTYERNRMMRAQGNGIAGQTEVDGSRFFGELRPGCFSSPRISLRPAV